MSVGGILHRLDMTVVCKRGLVAMGVFYVLGWGLGRWIDGPALPESKKET